MDDREQATDATEARLSDPTPETGRHPGGPHHSHDPFPAVEAAVRPAYATDSSGHTLDHAWRVFRLGQWLAGELGADREVLGCAALTHDLHRVVNDGEGCPPSETLDDIETLLATAGIGESTIGAVRHCVAVHDELAFRGDNPQPETTEAKILRDADNLDAMGAIGIARTFAFGGAHGSPLWDPQGQDYSQLYHFEDKLLRLRDELHTDPARRIGADRHDVLEAFFERFLAEWHGEA